MSTEALAIKVKMLPHCPGLPAYQTAGAAGFDFLAANEAPIPIEPGKIVLVPTGLQVAIPEGFELQVRPRSGLALRHGIAVLNSPGTIDSDFRGEVCILLANLGAESFTVERGMRVAQGVVAAYQRAEWQTVQSLPATRRGDGGFGHTGTHQ